MTDDLRIPRHGKAGVAFAGVEFQDAAIFLASFISGLIMGRWWGLWGYIVLPFAGYQVNRFYVDWKSNSTPGQFRQWLFEWGILGYSRAFDAQQTVFVGDGKIINKGSVQMNDLLLENASQAAGAQHGTE